MTTAENRDLVARIFAGMAEGDSRLLVHSMADDFAWTVTGQTPWSKTYAGKDVVLTELFGTLQSRIEGRIRTIADSITAEGDRVIVEAHGDNRTRDGQAYCNRYCFVFRLQDGRLKSVTEYLDTELVTRALGA